MDQQSEIDAELESHLEALYLRKKAQESRFGESRPVVVVDDRNEVPF